VSSLLNLGGGGEAADPGTGAALLLMKGLGHGRLWERDQVAFQRGGGSVDLILEDRDHPKA